MPDGIALDAKGRVWMAHPFAPECVLYAEGGEVVEVIDAGMPCFACMLGGDDGRSLFMLTAPTYHKDEASASPKGKLLVAKVDVPHAGPP
jgi:sugar lactone lactonase YvrE